MTAETLTIDGLGKSYDGRDVLSGVSLTVKPGERLALLGHNGAGKTTLMKLVLGLIRPDHGDISVLGAAPGSNVARSATAYLPESVAFHPALTGREQLRLFARLSGAPVASISDLLYRVGLTDAADRRIGTWSKGMRQRLGLAQVLLGRPKLALLDEPTSGLDPISRHELYAAIDQIAAQGCAVLISSHALTELEARTDRIAIMRQGRLKACDALAGLTAKAGLATKIRITARDTHAEALQDQLGGQRVNGAAIEILCPPDQKMTLLTQATQLGGLVADIDVAPPSLEDLYRHYSQEDAS